ncbi:hypothetical protein QE152_g30642 [Popillia japonica]|uniref:Uncharacterized protein n=1 Tax=Popillia japonica TaxID=7064 RepID=A0AAW1JF24_POPJA
MDSYVNFHSGFGFQIGIQNLKKSQVRGSRICQDFALFSISSRQETGGLCPFGASVVPLGISIPLVFRHVFDQNGEKLGSSVDLIMLRFLKKKFIESNPSYTS